MRQTVDHQVIAPSVFGFAALTLAPFLIREKNKKLKSLAIIAILSMLFVAIPANLPLEGIPPVLSYPTMLFGNAYETAVRLPQSLSVLSGSTTNFSQYQKRMAVIKANNHLPALNGSVDLFPAELNVILANNYNYQARPVIQSYLAYKESLLEHNKNFWQTSKAPDFIVLQKMEDTYGYYPSLHDGTSWIELLSRYEPFWCENSGLIVKKRETPIKFALKPWQTIEAKIGDAVTIKASSARDKIIFAKINTKITAIGSLQKLFFRIYPCNIEVKLNNGKLESYVAPTDNLRAGFILSPFACAPKEIKALYDTSHALLDDNQIIELKLSERENDLPWHILSEPYTIELFSLEPQT